MEYYLVVKRNKLLPFATTWIDLEVLGSEKLLRQRKKNTVCYHLYVESKKIQQTRQTSEYNKKAADSQI